MQESLFNVMNANLISEAVTEEIKSAGQNDLLIPLLCKGMSSDFSVEDFGSIRSMHLVQEYKESVLSSPFSLKVDSPSLEEHRLNQLTYMLDALEFKQERYLQVSKNELDFYDGMLDIVSGERQASLEASTAFGNGAKKSRAGGYVEDGVVKRVAETIVKAVKAVIKLMVGLMSNFLGYLSKSFELVSRFLNWVKSHLDHGAEKVGFKEAYIPKDLEKKIKNGQKSKVRDAGKNIADVLRAANNVDVTDEAEYTKFLSFVRKTFPGDIENLSPGDYIKTLIIPDPAEDKSTTLVTAEEFMSLLKRIDTSHGKEMKKVQKEAEKLGKTLTNFERENSKLYNELKSASSDEGAAAKEQYTTFNKRLQFLRRVVQVCTMVESHIVSEQLAINKQLQGVKPK